MRRYIMSAFLKYNGLMAILLVGCLEADAQHILQLNAGYLINIPAGSFRDLITNTAYRGFTAGISYPFTTQLSAGLSMGYNDYYQKYPRRIYTEGKTKAISAVVSNSIQQTQLMVGGNYTLLKTGIVRPYIGAGIGLNFINFDQYLGQFDNPHTDAKLAISGEAGIFIPWGSNTSNAVKIGGSYNYAPLKMYGINNLDNWGLHAGVRIQLR